MNYDVLDRVNNCILSNVEYADLFKEIYDLVRDLDKQHLLEMKHLKALNRVYKNEIKDLKAANQACKNEIKDLKAANQACKNEIKDRRKDIDNLSTELISISNHRVDSGKHWRVEYNAIVEKARQAIRGL